MVHPRHPGQDLRPRPHRPAPLNSITTTATNLTETNHYTDSTDSPAWQAGSDNTWTRNIQDPAGNLAAITTNTGSNELQLANIHGDIVATAPNTTTATGTDNYFESTEFGIARTTNTTTPRYGWLGTKRRDSTDTLAAITLMGQRLYNPTTGRFLQTDPIPGGNANAYDYCTGDPLNCTDLNGQWPHLLHRAWHWAWKHKVMIALTVASVALPVAGEALLAARGAEIAEAAFNSRWIGAGSRLFGNATAAGGRAGLLNPAGRGAWRLGWSVTADKTGWSFRAKIAGHYLDFFRGPRFR